MMYSVCFSDKAKKVLAKWKKSNVQLFRKVQRVIEDTAEHPRTGIGHPEPLVGGGGITYSRRITASDRMIYDIFDDVLEIDIVSMEGHYSDK